MATEARKELREAVAIALSMVDPDSRGIPDGVTMAEFYRSLADVAIALVGERMARVRAENEKLRAALRDIAIGQVTYLPFIQTVARAALEEEQ